MPLISSGLLVTFVYLALFLNQAGIPEGSLCDPSKCPSQTVLFAGLAYAPIGEELAFRILTPLGLVVPARVLWRRLITGQGLSASRLVFIIGQSLLSPEAAKRKIGYATVTMKGWRGIHWLEWIVLVFSSVVFGIVHIVPGGGTSWGVGKVVTAAISGLIIGIAYVAYGAYAAILLHWFFDFYFEVLLVGGQIFGGVLGTLPYLYSETELIVGYMSALVATGWVVRKIISRWSPTTYKTPK